MSISTGAGLIHIRWSPEDFPLTPGRTQASYALGILTGLRAISRLIGESFQAGINLYGELGVAVVPWSPDPAGQVWFVQYLSEQWLCFTQVLPQKPVENLISSLAKGDPAAHLHKEHSLGSRLEFTISCLLSTYPAFIKESEEIP